MPWGLRTRVRAAVGVRELGSGEDGCRGGRRGPGVGAPGLGSGDKDLGQRTEKIGIPGLEPESGDLGQSRGWGAALARGAGRGGGRQRAPVRRAAVALEGSCLRLTARPPPGDRAPPSAPPIPRGYSAPQSRPNPTALPWRPQAVSLPGHGFPARGGLGCSRRGTGAGAPGSRPRRPLLSSGILKPHRTFRKSFSFDFWTFKLPRNRSLWWSPAAFESSCRNPLAAPVLSRSRWVGFGQGGLRHVVTRGPGTRSPSREPLRPEATLPDPTKPSGRPLPVKLETRRSSMDLRSFNRALAPQFLRGPPLHRGPVYPGGSD
ncbi:unnamed protein product [Rangifer tarandus platyrhynchus]|uniref:Uncharacterized protein n=1 Tax=Rangifer tarandus platyrhynchus TaxID=3082113 RepID=A0AC59YXQ0_RANTA